MILQDIYEISNINILFAINKPKIPFFSYSVLRLILFIGIAIKFFVVFLPSGIRRGLSSMLYNHL